jgi:hypothetical protein
MASNDSRRTNGRTANRQLRQGRNALEQAEAAVVGPLEHLRGTALGFRNLTYYIARSVLEAGEFRPQLHCRLRRARLRLTRAAEFEAIGPKLSGCGDQSLE